jgi:hypothetical protein
VRAHFDVVADREEGGDGKWVTMVGGLYSC